MRTSVVARAGLLVLACLAGPLAALGEPTLFGRGVTFRILTYDDRDHPLYVGRLHRAEVTRSVEFGLGREGEQNELDVVPVQVDISATRIEVRYVNAEPGELAEAVFNGYVLAFDTECLLFQGARVDRVFSNLPMTADRVTSDGGTLYLDVSGLSYDRRSRFAVDFDVADCAIG